MKPCKVFSSSILLFTAATCLPVLLLSSCMKTPVNTYYNSPEAAMSFIQASPDEVPLDLFISDFRVNQVPVNYGNNSGYFSINAGTNSVSLFADATRKSILSDTINFVKNTTYSVFLVNKVSQPQLFMLTDTLISPTAGNASLRFVNLSPDAQAVDLVVKSGATLVSNRSFKGFSSFAPITGNTYYTFEVHQAGTATVLATLSNVKIDAGYVYTIWFHGLAAGTTATDQLSVDIINNAYFL
ncbi:MAG: DUF4397 domain-containing protein [Sphingobacteriales bacterium]